MPDSHVSVKPARQVAGLRRYGVGVLDVILDAVTICAF
jgi:hypothetical protein